MNEIRQKLIEILSEISSISKKEFESIDENYPIFTAGFSLGSIKSVELVFRLENYFHISIPDDLLNVDNFDTIAKILQLLDRTITMAVFRKQSVLQRDLNEKFDKE